jgi:putative ABC transport system permease protein
VLRAWIRLPLSVLPERFRRAYAADIVELLEERVRDERRERGAVAAGRLLARNLLDLFATVVAEWRDSSFRPPARLIPTPASAPHRGDPFVLNLIRDLKYALRSFRRTPAFIVVVAVTLALGIGANTAIFSVVNGVLLRPLPYQQPDDLIDVWGRFDPISGFDYPIFPLSPPEWVDYRAQSRAMEDVAAFTSSSTTLTGGDGDAERITTAPASHNLFAVLREQPLIGRTFSVEEDHTDARVVVLEHGFWQSRFGGDEALLGQTITLDGEPWTVLGVMPPGFSFVRDAKLWLPLGIDPENAGNRQSHFIRSLARLAPGATLEQAEAEMATLMEAWEAEFPDIHTGHYLYLSPLIEDVVGNVRLALLLLLAAAGLVLVIVCANVASVLLARGEDRTREFAIRGALGAGRGQIVRLLLAESAVLSLAGGLLGVAIAVVGVRLMMGAAGSAIPRAESVAVDGNVLLFAVLVTSLTAVLFGLAPALQGAAGDVQRHLKEGVTSASPSRSRLWFRRGLVVAEVALSFVLVLSAGLVLRSFQAVLAVDPGFSTEDLVVAGLSLPRARYQDSAAVQGFYAELIERVEGLPGVASASASSSLPLRSTPGVEDFRVEGEPMPGAGEPAWNASFSTVRPGYFETMRARLLRGRLFEPSDTADAELVTVINRSLVDKFFAGEDPLGRRIMVCCPDDGQQEPWMTIVGVIEDMRYQGLDVEARPAYYAVHAQVEQGAYGGVFASMTVVARAEGETRGVSAGLRALVQEIDADVPLVGLQTMDDVLAESVAQPRFTTRLLGSFALLALALGAVGIYGVLAYMVAQRSREIGIRKALGAADGALAAMVVAEGMGLVAAGLALGVGASMWASRLLDGLLFGVSASDPTTHVLVGLALAGVALLACCVPTLRAVRVDPLVTMRAE